MRIYGVLDSNDCQIDTSLTERGAKRHATLNGYNKISYRTEYYVTRVSEKVNGKWVKSNKN